MKSAFSSPGTPKMCVTPSASKQRTKRSEAFIVSPPALLSCSDIVLLPIAIILAQANRAAGQWHHFREK
jgi:hypothetical protein